MKSTSYWLVFAFASAACFIVSGVPLITIAWQLIGEGAKLIEGTVVPGFDERQAALLANSVRIAGGAAVLSMVLGGASGVALQVLRVPSRGLLLWLLPIPFLIPPYIQALAWMEILGKSGLLARAVDTVFAGQIAIPSLYSPAGAIWVTALAYFPIVAVTTVLGARGLDARYEEAAVLARGPRAALYRIQLPMLAPAIFTGGLIVFLLSVVGFSVPSLLQQSVYPVEIHTQFAAFYDIGAGLWGAVPLLGVGGIATLAWHLYMRRRRGWYSGHAKPAGDTRATRPLRIAAAALCWVLVGTSTVLPLAVLAFRSLPLSSFARAWDTAHEELLVSVIIASIAACVITGLAFLLAYFSRLRLATLTFSAVTLSPLLLSGPALGIALILAWNHAGWRGAVYDSIAIVVLASCARYLFFGFAAVATASRRLDPALFEAASVSGIPWHRQMSGILLPLTLPALVGVWGLSFVLCFGEVDAAVLVTPPGATTLPVRIFGLLHYGPSSLVAALSLLVVLIELAGAGLAVAAYALANRNVRPRLRIRHARPSLG